MKNINKIKKLVKSDCSCYFSEDNYCCKKDNKCMYFWDSDGMLTCQYFETSVLPLDTGLELEYNQDHNINTDGIIKCAKCKKPFRPTSGKQKYCTKCAKEVSNERSRKSMMNKRVKC